MASIYFQRLTDKYGEDNLTGKKYQAMIKEILAHNNEKAGKAVGRLSGENYKNSVKKLNKETAKTVKLPDISNVLPKRSVFMIKAADSGKSISQTLRTDLERNLRDTLKQFQGTGKPQMEIQRGRTTGKLNPELIKVFQDKITKTFESRTKKDPKTGVPPNVRNIAVTEIRSTVGAIKEKYNRQLMKDNHNIIMTKTWLHNRRLSKVPRQSHMNLHGVSVGMDEKFTVSREDGSGYDYMSRPHDPAAPAEQNIGCSCELLYKAKIKTYK